MVRVVAALCLLLPRPGAHGHLTGYVCSGIPHPPPSSRRVVSASHRRHRRPCPLLAASCDDDLACADGAAAAVEGEGGAPTPPHPINLTQPPDIAAVVGARAARVIAPLTAALGVASSLWAGLGIPEPASAGFGAPEPFRVARKESFPGSVKSSIAQLRIDATLLKRGYRPSNTIVGASLCDDDRSSDGLANRLAETYSPDGRTVLRLGGRGGLPFAGRSNLEALVGKCPSSGNVLLVFGPHVGISEDGEVGRVRWGRDDDESVACSTAVDAYTAIANGASGSVSSEEKYIVEKLRGRLGGVNLKGRGNSEAITVVTKQMYKLVRDLLLEELAAVTGRAGFWNDVGEVTLCGGIMINRSKGRANGGEDCFQPVMMKALTAGGEVDLYEKVFGDLDVPLKEFE